MHRREFLSRTARILGGMVAARALGEHEAAASTPETSTVKLALFGDVMTGRGIDQVLPHPSQPEIYESYARSATAYVELAEVAHGPIPRPVKPDYIWGDALTELERFAPDCRIINLETSITRSGDHWSGKGIHYRMHPENIACLTAASIDCCALANNHVLDWGYSGLAETLASLEAAGIEPVGAGNTSSAAAAPAVLDLDSRRRVLVYSMGMVSSGIPREWAATDERPGVNLLPSFSDAALAGLVDRLGQGRRRGDLVVLSIHWGSNWGYEIPDEHRQFAQTMIDEARVDVVHGHSSHHPRGIEVYHGKPILYGCGDFLNDYEGIGGYEDFRPDLTLMYQLSFASSPPRLQRLEMMPFQIRNFQLRQTSADDSKWLQNALDVASRPLATRVELSGEKLRVDPTAWQLQRGKSSTAASIES